MSMNTEGRYDCDRCGVDVGNAGVRMAVVVSDLDPDNIGQVRNLHFCRDRVDSEGAEVKGCARKILSAANLAHYRETHEHAGQPVPGPIDDPHIGVPGPE